MREIQVKEATFQQHAAQLDSKSTGNYLPLKKREYGLFQS